MDLKLKDNTLLSIDNMMNVDYILASGQCNVQLLTLAIGSNYYIIDLDIEVVSNTTEGAYVFQATKGSGSQLNYLQCTSTNADTFNWAWATNNSAGSNTSFSGRCKIRIKRSSTTNSSITINGTSTASTFTYGGDNYTHPLYLLPSDGITMKIWSIQIYKVSSSSTTPSSSNIIANFVPRISYSNGHYGEAALYDTISNTFKYSSSTGSFTDSTDIRSSITAAFVKDCPNISGINLLRRAINIQRIRCNIDDVLGSLEELQHYATLSGYSDNYEEQTKPRIVGNFTINTYHTNEEKNSIDIDGLVLFSDNNYNVDYLLDNNLIAVQTVDENEEGYNQPIADILESNGFGNTISSDSSKFFITKNETAAITSLANTLFRDNSSITTFNEFKYWTGLTSLTNGGNTTTDTGAFGNCTLLESIEIPEGITKIGNASFCNDSALSRIVLPSTLNTSGANSFTACNGFADGDVYFNGTLLQWMNITFETTGTTNPTAFGSHLYIQGTELTSLDIPNDVTAIKQSTFRGCKYITGQLVIPSSVTSIGNYAFGNCSGLTGINIQNGVTSIGNYAFTDCSGLTGTLIIPNSVTSIGTLAFSATNFTSAKLPKELPTTHNVISMFRGNNVIKDITIGSTVSISIGDGSYSCGDGTGTLTVYANAYSPRNSYTGRFKNFIIHGNYTTERSGLWNNPINNIPYSFRVKNTIGSTLSSAFLSYVSNTPYNASTLSFVECGNIEAPNAGCLFAANSTRSRADNCILHINRNTLPTNYAANVPYYKVGLGLSRAEDEATLALYLADSTWSAQSAKLGTWYDYNGEYKWYYITDNLTNCTNTNSVDWPHITRGESYYATIVPDEGMTIDPTSVHIRMLDTDTSSPTYDTYVDQPVAFYSDTGIAVVNISSVTGNVVITASAS